MLKVESLEKRLGLGLARSRSLSRLVAKIRRLGLVSVSWNCRKVLVSVSSRTKNQMSRSRKLRSRLHPWCGQRPWCVYDRTFAVVMGFAVVHTPRTLTAHNTTNTKKTFENTKLTVQSDGLHCVRSPPSVPQHDRTTHGRRLHDRTKCDRLVRAVTRSAFSITA